MLKSGLIACLMLTFVAGCKTLPEPAPVPDTASTDLCDLLKEIEWEEEDAAHVSDRLARSLGLVLEAEAEAECSNGEGGE